MHEINSITLCNKKLFFAALENKERDACFPAFMTLVLRTLEMTSASMKKTCYRGHFKRHFVPFMSLEASFLHSLIKGSQYE